MGDHRTRFTEADDKTVKNVKETVDALKGHPRDKVDQILVDHVQHQMKDHPYLPGQTKAFVQTLSDSLAKSGGLPGLELVFNPKTGHAEINDANTHKTINVGITIEATKTWDHKEIAARIRNGQETLGNRTAELLAAKMNVDELAKLESLRDPHDMSELLIKVAQRIKGHSDDGKAK